jgi:membrane-associated phospholipid phosphatase
MTLAATEFLRRFFLHVLPKGFVRIRHFGFVDNRFRTPAPCPLPATASYLSTRNYSRSRTDCKLALSSFPSSHGTTTGIHISGIYLAVSCPRFLLALQNI